MKNIISVQDLAFSLKKFSKSAEAILDFNGMGLSILEISHRSKDFIAVMDEARAIVKD